MSVKRLDCISGLAIDKVAAAAGGDPAVLRLESLDTDLPPPPGAIAATKSAVGTRSANSYLPFAGSRELRGIIARKLSVTAGYEYSADTEVVITCGGTEGLFDALLATTDPGDEVILTDPTYAGMINRVRLCGGSPQFVPFREEGGSRRLDLEALHDVVTPQTRAMLIMNPSMPSGAVMNHQEWEAVAQLCARHNLWLIYNAAMERILYDDTPLIHPARLPGMVERTIIVGSMSKEYRMIGWRVGWVAGHETVMADIARVRLYNVVTPTGIAQAGACAALETPVSDLDACIHTWKMRRDVVLEELAGYPIIPARGGWSMLLDVGSMGYDSFSASELLLEKGRVAATPMRDWGEEHGDRFVRLVFSNEPVERLRELRDRFSEALPAR